MGKKEFFVLIVVSNPMNEITVFIIVFSKLQMLLLLYLMIGLRVSIRLLGFFFAPTPPALAFRPTPACVARPRPAPTHALAAALFACDIYR